MQRRSRRTGWLAALALLGAVLLLLWLSGIGAQAWQAGALLADIARGHTSAAIDRLPHPLVRTADGSALSANPDDATPGAAIYFSDLYLPPSVGIDELPTAAGMVLVPGASPGGKDEKLLIAFAGILANAGYVVLVPDLPGLRDQQVNPSHAGDIADAAHYLSSRLGGRKVAVAAISYAVGPAVIAATMPEGATSIAFILGIGGYYDATATTTYITTGNIRDADGTWQVRTPNAYGKWVFVWSNLGRIASPNDRALLDTLVRRKFDDPDAAVDDLVVALGPEGRAVWALLANTDPERVPDLIGMLPPRIREALDGLDLARRDLSGVQAELLLVHGADDPILPPEGSIALADAVPHSRLYLIDALTHVELSLRSLDDAWALYRACWSLIGWRDRLVDEG
jgi:pimeloyl-ACP methyl ester carboxylesterase